MLSDFGYYSLFCLVFQLCEIWLKHCNVIYDGNVECRNAIRDMVVRGAPAIAIAAALTLAVEVENLRPFSGTGAEAVTFLQKRLDYLVSRSDPPSCHQNLLQNLYVCKICWSRVGPTPSQTPAVLCFLAFKNTISEILVVKNYYTWKQKWRSKINSQVESDNIWRKKREFVATNFYYLLISGICFLYKSSRPIDINLADAATNFVSYCSTLSAGGYKIWWS